jgi:hypothetical protein
MDNDTVHGHGTSQLQFSKYVPSSFHAISPSSVGLPAILVPLDEHSQVRGQTG